MPVYNNNSVVVAERSSQDLEQLCTFPFESLFQMPRIMRLCLPEGNQSWGTLETQHALWRQAFVKGQLLGFGAVRA